MYAFYYPIPAIRVFTNRIEEQMREENIVVKMHACEDKFQTKISNKFQINFKLISN